MSYQIREQILINGFHFETFSQPLSIYEEVIKQKLVENKDRLSALWRDYVGCWEINFGRLFLHKILIPDSAEGSLLKEISYKPIFNTDDKVFARWFSGEIVVPKGRIIMEDFYENIYEINAHYIFTHGILTDHYNEDNTKRNWKPDPF